MPAVVREAFESKRDDAKLTKIRGENQRAPVLGLAFISGAKRRAPGGRAGGSVGLASLIDFCVLRAFALSPDRNLDSAQTRDSEELRA